mmetsp:Transcript_4843/g.13963  ORF Transcript_4843/g.13963 Transcript_4843/m.13963 type:complete len:325 (-) Transcript_4843:137-1111(-)
MTSTPGAASTSTMCVVPLRTNGRAHFSLDAGPMPASLVGRLSEAEYYGVTERINKALLPLAHFGLSSLLLPFLAIDALTVAVLYGADPSLLVAPLSQDLPDLLLPVLLEITLVAAAFPLVSLLVSRRIGRVQALVREVLDDASRTFAPRGVHFSLKLGVTGAGASTNMWVEMQVAPLFRVPVPVPVPTLYPILLPSANEHAAPGASPPSPTPANSKQPQGRAQPQPPLEPSSSAAALRGEASHEAAQEGGAAPGSLAEEVAAAAAAGSLTPQQQEYLRVLQENQLLRQYLAQTQALVQLQAQHASALAARTQPPAGPAALDAAG